MTQLFRYPKQAALGAALALTFAAGPALASVTTYSGTECNGGDNTFFDGAYSNNTGVVADVVQCPIPLGFDPLRPNVGVVATVRDQNTTSNFSCTLRAVTVLAGGGATIQTSLDSTTGSSANYDSINPASIAVFAPFTSMSLQCSVPAVDVTSSRIAHYIVTRS